MNQRNLFDIDPEPVGHYGYPLRLDSSGRDVTDLPGLWDETDSVRLARKDDPETSKIAAAEAKIKSGLLHRTIAEWLSEQPEPLTAREIAEGVKRDCEVKCEVETIRKRVGELEDLQLDFRVMIAGVRKCSVTGKLAEIWEVVK
jgi:hypothetical protein